jgi:hypothetical protein
VSATGAVPRLTLGPPVYKGERFLAASLNARLAQTFTDFELIISDNGSTDCTGESPSGTSRSTPVYGTSTTLETWARRSNHNS